MGTVREEELHAYIDGALSPSRRAEIEAYLAAHPEEARRAEAYRTQKHGLHALYGGRPDEAIPDEFVMLASKVDGSLRRRRRGKRTLCMLAAGGAAALMAAAGWLAHDRAPVETAGHAVPRRTIEAHPDSTLSPGAPEGGEVVSVPSPPRGADRPGSADPADPAS